MRLLLPLLPLLLSALTLGSVTACGPGEPAPELNGPVLLIVAEAPEPSEETPDAEGLYVTYSIPTQNARAFTRQDLASLRWRQIESDFPAGSDARVFEGPRLSAVLAEAGIRPDTSVRLTGFDGYEAEIDARMIDRHEPILAMRADGRALATGGLGPLMLVWPRSNRGELADMEDDLWAWGVFAITPIAPDAVSGSAGPDN